MDESQTAAHIELKWKQTCIAEKKIKRERDSQLSREALVRHGTDGAIGKASRFVPSDCSSERVRLSERDYRTKWKRRRFRSKKRGKIEAYLWMRLEMRSDGIAKQERHDWWICKDSDDKRAKLCLLFAQRLEICYQVQFCIFNFAVVPP